LLGRSDADIHVGRTVNLQSPIAFGGSTVNWS